LLNHMAQLGDVARKIKVYGGAVKSFEVPFKKEYCSIFVNSGCLKQPKLWCSVHKRSHRRLSHHTKAAS
jgi:hypothetical protein